MAASVPQIDESFTGHVTIPYVPDKCTEGIVELYDDIFSAPR
ncbi:hypothetical protein [Pseudochrobactrum algeriensis]|nr:hypothetical protein [Pseudochrobactrum algeriensis]